MGVTTIRRIRHQSKDEKWVRQMGKAEDRVVAKLQRNGGEIRAPEDKYRLPAAKELFGVTNNTLSRMVQNGIIEKEGTATSTTVYRLVRPGTFTKPKKETQNRIHKKATEVLDEARQTAIIGDVVKELFGNQIKDLGTFMQWLDLTREMMQG
jgi:hypothetical protein